MKNLCSMSPQNLLKILNNYLKSIYDEKDIISTESYLFAKGKNPLLLCAHVDTVFLYPPIHIYTDKEAKVMWAPAGLGADDRAGVYAIIQILESGFTPSVLFTTDEEIGCIGSQQLVQDFPKCPFNNITSIVQLDRQGYAEAVFYNCNNKIFEDWICTFGFKKEKGTFSDISVLCPCWGIAGVNLSVGYYNEHSQTEYLKWEQLEYTIEKVKLMIPRSANFDKPFRYIPKFLNNDFLSFYKKI